jgi:asparagine synthase (glutamine-hydrolysing)
MNCKFKHAADGKHGTKVVLREAFEVELPAEVVSREKASFPLPFQEWVGDGVGVLRESALAREVFSEAAIHAVTTQPAHAWRFAWPMVNIAMWGKVWWG